MRALLDVNVLIALLDANHVFHEKAHDWWEKNQAQGWASCPLSENGVVRIMTGTAYPRQKRFVPREVIGSLQNFASTSAHQFWADDLSLRGIAVFDSERILNGQHLTDFYLLALAAKNQGRLVTFDQNISLSPVRIAKPENLLVL
jgi:toxin-antitoxin system PIN domain toxin